MTAITKLVILSLLLVSVVWCQPTTPVTGVSKCVIPFYFTVTGTHAPQANTTAGYDNRQDGCSNWVLYASNIGFTVVSLLVESAPAAASNLPGTYVSFAGTIVSGVNPFVSTTQASTVLTGFYPWVRVTATLTGSGAVVGVLLGDPTPPSNIAPVPAVISGTVDENLKQINGTTVLQGNGVTGLGSQRVTVASDNTSIPVTPLANSTIDLNRVGGTAVVNGGLAGSQSIGGTAAQGAAPTANPILIAGLGSGGAGVGVLSSPVVCDQSAVITVSAAATTQIVSLVASKKIRVCSFSITLSTAGTVQFVYGTGVDCGTGTTNLTGAMNVATNGSINFWGGGSLFNTINSNALCLSAVTGNASGVLSYAQF